MLEQKPNGKSRFFGPLIFIGVIALILILIFGGIYLFTNAKCGSGGGFVWSGDYEGGIFCRYSFTVEKGTECPKCDAFCKSKGKESISYAGQPVSFGFVCNCECK